MEFMTPAELSRQLRHAKQVRVRDLMAHGYAEAEARAAAEKEFGEYDILEIDNRGRVRLLGLELPSDPRPDARRRARNQAR